MNIFDFIEDTSYDIAKYIGINDSEDEVELYEYSIFMIFSNTFTIGIGLMLSLLLGYFKYFIISEISFILIRTVAGGSHCETFKKCFFISNIMSIMGSLFALFTEDICNITLIMSIFSFILTMPVCPKPSTNSPSRGYFGDIEFRKKMAYRGIILFSISILFLYLDINFISSSISSGLLMVCFALSDTGEKIIEKISKFF